MVKMENLGARDTGWGINAWARLEPLISSARLAAK